MELRNEKKNAQKDGNGFKNVTNNDAIKSHFAMNIASFITLNVCLRLWYAFRKLSMSYSQSQRMDSKKFAWKISTKRTVKRSGTDLAI